MREDLLMFWLSLEGHIAKIKLDILEANFGSLAEAHSAISKGKYGNIKGIGEKQLERLRFLSNMSEIEDKYANMVEKGIKYTHYFNKDYPDKLRNICSAPIGLFYKGSLPNNEEKIISVVGSRDATEKGLYYAAKISEELSNNGVSVVSGMALGIDSSAHNGAKRRKRQNLCYPRLWCGYLLSGKQHRAVSVYRRKRRNNLRISYRNDADEGEFSSKKPHNKRTI